MENLWKRTQKRTIGHLFISRRMTCACAVDRIDHETFLSLRPLRSTKLGSKNQPKFEDPPRSPREPNMAELRHIPEIILGIPISFKVYSLVKPHWTAWEPTHVQYSDYKDHKRLEEMKSIEDVGHLRSRTRLRLRELSK